MAASSRKPTKKPPEPMNVTEYWEAVQTLVDDMEERERKGEFKDVATDEAYQVTKKVLREMAAKGVTLESTNTTELDALGKEIIKIRGQFKKPDEVPAISGSASYALAIGYQKLLKHFGGEKSGEEKVRSTSTAIQFGLDYKIPFKTKKAGYKDAKDSANALKDVITKWEHDHPPELKETKREAPPVVAEVKSSEPSSTPASTATIRVASTPIIDLKRDTPPPAVLEVKKSGPTPVDLVSSLSPDEALELLEEELKDKPSPRSWQSTPLPKTPLQRIREGENPKITIIEYWLAVSELIKELEAREKKGEFGTPEEVAKDTEYQKTKALLLDLAKQGVALEDSSGLTLMHAIERMNKLRETFTKTGGHKITGRASYALAEAYLPLVAHFGRSWSLSDDKNTETKEGVYSRANHELQTAFRNPHIFVRVASPTPFYKQAALDAAALKIELDRNQQFNPKRAAEVKASISLEEQIAAKEAIVRQKDEAAKAQSDIADRELKKFRELTRFLAMDEKKRTTEMKSYEGEGGKENLRKQIEEKLKFLYDEETPRETSEEIYNSLKENLSAESKAAWENRIKNASRGDISSYGGGTEGFHRRALANILATELSSCAKKINTSLSNFNQINAEKDRKALAELREKKKNIDEFKREASGLPPDAVQIFLDKNQGNIESIQQMTELLHELNKLKPEGEVKVLPIAKFGEMKNVSTDDVRRLVYQTACEEVGKLLKNDEKKMEKEELGSAIASINGFVQAPNNPQALVKLTQAIDKLARKKTTVQTFKGVWMMFKGKVTGNETLYKAGWALRTGYDVGQYELRAAFKWLHADTKKTKKVEKRGKAEAPVTRKKK